MNLDEVPKFVVLEAGSGVRLDFELESPACEIEAELDHPEPGRSFILMIGHPGGPFVQRARISGGARLLFDPERPGTYVLLVVNPTEEPLVVHLEARSLTGIAVASSTRTSRQASRRRGLPAGTANDRPVRRNWSRSKHGGNGPTHRGTGPAHGLRPR
jgi:hypothetical protein